MPPAFFFFLKIALAIWDLCQFHRNFRIICAVPVKNAIGILTGIALNLWIALGSMNILTILILPIHEHRLNLILHLRLTGSHPLAASFKV